MTTRFIATTAKSIDERLAAINEEIALLEGARVALAPSPRPKRQAAKPQGERRLTAKQRQALALIEATPGITAAELSRALGGTYGYTVVSTFRSAGEIEPCGSGWQVKR